MIVKVTDLCGRIAPYVTDTASLPDETVDTLWELIDENEGDTFYIGEYQYDILDDTSSALCS